MVGWRRGLIAVAGGLCIASARADLADMTGDGWYTWKVESRASAHDLCCFSWNRGIATQRECNLDDHRGGYGSIDDKLNSGAGLQLYVRRKAGQAREIKALSASCPVTADTEIRDVGPVANSDSIEWLRKSVGSGEDLADDAILAIGFHAGGGVDTLIEIVEDRSLDMDLRESALFWLVQSGSDEAFAYVDRILGIN